MSETHINLSMPTAETAGYSLQTKVLASALALASLGVVGHRLNEKDQQIERLEKSIALQEDQLERLAGLTATELDIATDTVLGRGLEDVDKLPGAGRLVSTDLRTQLEGAAVKLFSRPKGSNYAWSPSCSGTKITDGDEHYVITAAHCFNYSGYSKGGYLGGTTPQGQAMDIVEADSNTYGVQTAELPGGSEYAVPVTAISVIGHSDWALLKVDENNKASDEFLVLPAVPADAVFGDQEPVVGQQTVGFSSPGAANAELLEGEGVYLGTVSTPGNEFKEVRIIGLTNSAKPDKDACNYGASGSVAVYASGNVTGPLSWRNNIGYEEGSIENPRDDLRSAPSFRLEIEDQLKVDTSRFNTLCGFAVDSDETFTDLKNGLDHPVPLPNNTGSYK
ncbi:MAG TPA: trypsin-like peptidase domain-containing protein [Candidatus Limnocylindrales bacterium]|nr:trypsin-like peptidase domain-containing protein [Candidatus Limnocylindrales bacterium]